MGSIRPEREDAQARTAYLAAARRFVDALAGYVATGVPWRLAAALGSCRRGAAPMSPHYWNYARRWTP